MVETRWRSILKALTWRLGGLVTTVLVAYVVTGQAALAASIGMADTLVKIGAYYAHERLWLRIRMGRARPDDYEI